MELQYVNQYGVAFIEGVPSEAWLTIENGATELIEACFSNGVQAALLYIENVPPGFFDLKSRQAGLLLQKLQNYHLRLAVVLPPDTIALSERFQEMVAEERRGSLFGLYETREAAIEWIERTQ